jgi:hypothetical protein
LVILFCEMFEVKLNLSELAAEEDEFLLGQVHAEELSDLTGFFEVYRHMQLSLSGAMPETRRRFASQESRRGPPADLQSRSDCAPDPQFLIRNPQSEVGSGAVAPHIDPQSEIVRAIVASEHS